MPEIEANGTTLYYELDGEGEPLALVHGSWTDANGWRLVAPGLAESFRVLTYDRRGHSRSARSEAQGSIDEDGHDLAALLEALELAPAHVATSSWGGNIALRLALRRPEVFRSLSCHEPPLFGLLAGNAEAEAGFARSRATLEQVASKIAAGDHEDAAHQFVDEVAFGPGAWEHELPDEVRAAFVNNAPTYLDELQDPNQLEIDAEGLRGLELPLRITLGTESPSIFAPVAERLLELVPGAVTDTYDGASHGPQASHPALYVEGTRSWLEQIAA